MHGITKPMYVIPNMNDVKFWKQKVKPVWDDKKITIGYAGSNSHQDDLQMVMPAIANLMKKYPNLHFQLLGSIEKDLIPTYFKGFTKESMNRIEVGAAESVFYEYPAWLGQQAWDIGIAPLVDTPFTRCKSHIKWLEYSMFKIPVVASRVYPYFMPIRNLKTIEDGVTGLLVRSHEWESKLEKLILDPKLRKTLGENAYKVIKRDWQYKNSQIGEILAEMLENLFKD
jgi:glycosyltransferase involved in cell wall biosynthesis